MLGHIVLNITDYTRSKTFYEQFLLSLWYTLSREEDHDDCMIGSRKNPDENLQFMLRQDKKNPVAWFVRNIWLDHFCFEVKEKELVDLIYEKLLEIPTNITKSPMQYPDYSDEYYAFYFRDPDNIPLEIAYIWQVSHKESEFDRRNKEKKQLDQKVEYPFINEREIRFIKLWKNIWCEQNWKDWFLRPFLIIKKIGTLFWWIPLTTGWKQNSKWYIDLPMSSFHDERHKKENAKVCLWHAKTIDPRRCMQHIGTVNKMLFGEIKKSLQMVYL